MWPLMPALDDSKTTGVRGGEKRRLPKAPGGMVLQEMEIPLAPVSRSPAT